MTGLSLPGDRETVGQTLEDDHLDRTPDDAPHRAAAKTVLAIAEAAGPVAFRLSQAELLGDPARVVGTNTGGDRQKALDVASHEHFLAALRGAGVEAIASEEADEVAEGVPGGLVSVAIDPIDGSSGIGVGALLGTLFAVLPARDGKDVYRQSGRALLAAGYISYGHSVDFGFSVGKGVAIATFAPGARIFRVVAENIAIPAGTSEVAFNALAQRHWSPGVRAYVEACVAGREGERGRDFNMRWMAAAVGDLQRILKRGGMFFYAADRRPGYEAGRLRLVYEANPIAFLCEQAGGAATDGLRPILDIPPAELHQHTPLVFGSREEVETFGRYLSRAD